MLPWWCDVILLLFITYSCFWSLTPLLYYPQNSLKHTFEIHSSMLWPESISCMQSTMQDWRDSFMLFKSAASHTSTPDTRGTCNKTIKKIYLDKASQWPASMQIYCNKRKRLHEKRVPYPRGLVWDTNMAAVSSFWDTNMAAVTSCENTLYWHRVVL